MNETLLNASLETWKRILKKERTNYPVFLIAKRPDLSKPEIQLGTDDFVFLMMEYAEEIGIDLKEYGRKLVGNEVREDLLIFHAGTALRTIFEVEGYYVEYPSAYTFYKIPKQFLIVVGAALIGIATGKAAQLNPVLGGAVGGVGSLLINILAARYMDIKSSEGVEITWTEEFILKILENRGELSLKELQRHTKLYKQTIKETLEGLLERKLVEKHKVLKSGASRADTKYYLKKRQ